MSEEEIIENVKELIGLYKSNMQGYSYQAIQGLLDLYNKQKEEIKQKTIMAEAFKKALGDIIQGKKWCKEIKGGKTLHIDLHENCISKDKIRDRIEQLESYYDSSKETTPTSTNQFIIDVVAILEELLEEE